jgi:hypothetical protein
MSDRESLLELLRAHTVPTPGSLPDAASVLEGFEQAASGLSAPEQERLAREPRHRDAMLAFLTYRFTPLDLDVLRSSGTFDAAMEAAGHVLKLSASGTQERFLVEIVMNLAHPADHRFFAPTLRRLIGHDTMEQVLLAHARSDNGLHQRNVFALMRYLYSDASYPLSAAAGRELHEIALRVTRSEHTNSHLRETVASFALGGAERES